MLVSISHFSEVEVVKEQRWRWGLVTLYCLPGLYCRRCQLISREDVTHDTRLFCLMLPPSTHLQVPVGQHVYLKLSVTGKGNGGLGGVGELLAFLGTWL